MLNRIEWSIPKIQPEHDISFGDFIAWLETKDAMKATTGTILTFALLDKSDCKAWLATENELFAV